MARDTGDIVILVLTVAVSALLLISGVLVAFVAVFQPEADWSGAVRNVADTINTVVGALIGYLAGSQRATRKRDDEK